MKPEDLQDAAGNLSPKDGGRTALHVACMRESDCHVSPLFPIRCLAALLLTYIPLTNNIVCFQNASKVVALLLSHSASTDLLWSGHSPLSLAIATGNHLVNPYFTPHSSTVCVRLRLDLLLPGSGGAAEGRGRS